MFLMTTVWLAWADSSPATEDHAFFHENVMGTSLELRVLADRPEAARWAERCVLEEIDRLSRIFSGYDASSEFRRWQATRQEPVRVSPELYAMLAACDAWKLRSAGAFDPGVEVLSRLWEQSGREKRLPSEGELSDALARLRAPAWRLDARSGTAEHRSDVPLTLNAIAKGEIIERACAAALAPERGVRGLLLNVGGDLRVCGEAPRRVGIVPPWADSESAEPIAIIGVEDRAVATSGNSQRGYQIGDRWYSHILDPRTGRPVERVLSATVVAPRSSDADALATIANVLEPEETMRLVAAVPGAECLVITADGQRTVSPGWKSLERPMAVPLARAAGGPSPVDAAGAGGEIADAPWNREFELVVNFEINLPEGEGRRYRRPYVAVWVEDPDGKLVRTISLWVSMGGAGPFQWIPDLKRWYRAEQERKQIEKKDLFFTLARPTRPPGKYRVVWDGKDSQGKPVPAGEYTILIDAAREHGTYQNIRKQVKLSDQPFTEELRGNVEIKSATIEYRRKNAARAAR
jgi:thiamine biosynthesis lipoprotein ApbE